jgi:polysaccharide export outer membrane protein
MRTGLRKHSIATLLSLSLAALMPCASMHGQGQGQSQGQSQGGAALQIMTANPYIQSAPNVSGQAMQQPGGLILPNQEMGNNSSSGSVFFPDIKTYVLSPGDLINVRLYSVSEYNTTLRLSNDGTGQLPLIGTLALAGLTIERAQIKIEDALKSAGMYRDPHITITLGEYDDTQSSVLFTGELHGRVPARKAHTLAEALNAEGGLPPGASSVISIIRPGVNEPILVDLGTTAKDQAKADVPLQAKDTIFIQRAGGVYVVGAFKATGLFPMQPGRTTLMQVAALAGGPMFSAKYADMRIIRTVGTDRTEVKVDIQKVLYGKAPDPIMQPGDIVFLPSSAVKAALASGGLSTLLGLANLAVIVATR